MEIWKFPRASLRLMEICKFPYRTKSIKQKKLWIDFVRYGNLGISMSLVEAHRGNGEPRASPWTVWHRQKGSPPYSDTFDEEIDRFYKQKHPFLNQWVFHDLAGWPAGWLAGWLAGSLVSLDEAHGIFKFPNRTKSIHNFFSLIDFVRGENFEISTSLTQAHGNF